MLNDAFAPYGMRVCFMAEYFLPDVTVLTGGESGSHEPWVGVSGTIYEIRLLESRDFQNLYLPQWSNALCEKRRELDVLGVGAYRENRLIGLAACSTDCENMWQIGIDVLPEFRRQGIASSLTTRLAREILGGGKVPFYCCAWSNIGSARNAIRSGFRPAWVELTVKPKEFVDEMNGQVLMGITGAAFQVCNGTEAEIRRIFDHGKQIERKMESGENRTRGAVHDLPE